jgi:formylmethanofuran--tetrahydromethanopterin N-formyltransferase
VTPFPGGVVRSGSKTWSKYSFLRASTNSAYCPMLKGQVESALPEEVNSVLEIVIDGLSEEAIALATRVGVQAACRPGVVRISAGNYGGTLGQYQFHLHELLGNGE